MPSKIIQVKEISKENITDNKKVSLKMDEYCVMNTLSVNSTTIDISTEAASTIDISTENNTGIQMQGPQTNQSLNTIPLINWQQRMYKWLMIFANGVAKRGMLSFGVILIITFMIGYKIGDQSLHFSMSRLITLLPLMWIRHSDEITEYVVKKVTDFYRTYF